MVIKKDVPKVRIVTSIFIEAFFNIYINLIRNVHLCNQRFHLQPVCTSAHDKALEVDKAKCHKAHMQWS